MRLETGKRVSLGALALLAPLPLPYNEIIGWPLLIGFWVAVVLFIREVSAGRDRWLPHWAMNLLGLSYLPFFYLDLSASASRSLLTPLVHLALFVLAVKLYALRSVRDQWHAMFATFFLFLASMGTSVHPSIVIYLLVFLVMTMLTLARFAGGHVQSMYGNPDTADPVRSRSFVVLGTALTLVVAVPLFAILPRFDTPYLFKGGGPVGPRRSSVTGFSEQMSLDGIGRIRTSREVVMRLRYGSEAEPPDELRLKGASYELFRETSWHRGALRPFPLSRSADDTYRLAPGDPVLWAEVWLQPLGGPNLVVPIETIAVDIEGTAIRLDPTGNVALYGPARTTLYYRAGLADGPLTVLPPRRGAESIDPDFLDAGGVTERIEAYAAEVMGGGPMRARVERLEQHLIDEYTYTLDLMGRSGEGIIERFLFEDRRGHCEYFATAMVLMLRSQGVPARVVTGFYGGEYSRRQNYFIVRQSNAHAWVEARLGDEGWITFDPTPPAGRPASSSSWRTAMTQAWDAFIFRWDRYVLTYGLYDQMRAFGKLADLWGGMWKPKQPAAARPEPAPTETPDTDSKFAFELDPRMRLALAALALVAAFIVWWRRPRFTAARAYARLRQTLPDVEPSAVAGLAPLDVKERFRRAYPGAAASGGRVIDLYIAESFAGRTLGEAEQRELRQQHREALRGVRKSA